MDDELNVYISVKEAIENTKVKINNKVFRLKFNSSSESTCSKCYFFKFIESKYGNVIKFKLCDIYHKQLYQAIESIYFDGSKHDTCIKNYYWEEVKCKKKI